MISQPPDEFYIGYDDHVPPRLGRWIRRVVGVLGLVAPVVAVAWAANFRLLPASTFEYGSPRWFEGRIETVPYPALLHAAPMATSAEEPLPTSLLVAPFKHGAAALVQPFDGQWVRLRGTRIARGSEMMIEVVPDSIEPLPPPAARVAEAETAAVVQTLRGEIVDSKCFLGVMNPGERKVHRDCAVRCISGGIPPAFVSRDAAGRERIYRLTDASGAPIGRALLDIVGEPVEVTGRVVRRGGEWWLRADAREFRRLVP
jgi:hypothetical protein